MSIRIYSIIVFFAVLPLWCGCNGEARERAKEKELAEQRANITAAKAQVSAFVTPLLSYRMNLGDFPSTAQGLQVLRSVPTNLAEPQKWLGPYINKDLPLDPWGNVYLYMYPGVHNSDLPDIWSRGPDGKSGNEDDIGNW